MQLLALVIFVVLLYIFLSEPMASHVPASAAEIPEFTSAEWRAIGPKMRKASRATNVAFRNYITLRYELAHEKKKVRAIRQRIADHAATSEAIIANDAGYSARIEANKLQELLRLRLADELNAASQYEKAATKLGELQQRDKVQLVYIPRGV